MGKLDKWLGLMKVEFDKNSPEILTGLGVAGMFASAAFAVHGTVKAVRAVDAKKKKLKKDKLTVGETLKTTWKYYIPAAITIATSTACVIGANSVNTRRSAALAAAYSISESALSEYKGKVKEIVGEAKEKEIQAEVQKDQIRENPPRTAEIILTGKGETLFKETISGRYFKSDIEKVRRAENELNREMRDSMEISLNEVYIMLGLPMTNDVNDYIGWDIDHGYIEFQFVPVMTEDGQACIAIEYKTPPRPFAKFA